MALQRRRAVGAVLAALVGLGMVFIEDVDISFLPR